MRVGVRPYVTAGVALVGAGVIAVTPISPAPAEVAVAQPAVQLAAIPSPLQLYPEVVLRSVSNAGALFQEYFANPFPIVSATLRNEAAAFEAAATALQTGQVDEFFDAAAQIVLQPFTSAGAALFHLGAILSQPFALQGYALIAISPVLSGLVATGKAIGEVFDAIVDLDLVGVVNAVLNIPARIIDGVLNGVPGASVGILDSLPGLLTPSDPESPLPPGPISVGINLDQDMGAAIPPYEPPAAADDIPDPDAATVTLTADVPPAAGPDPDADPDDGAAKPLRDEVIEADDATDDAEPTDEDLTVVESDDPEADSGSLDGSEKDSPAADPTDDSAGAGDPAPPSGDNAKAA